jgi:hypothetical protein
MPAARAFPPMRPSATAAGFFPSSSGDGSLSSISPVAILAIIPARALTSAGCFSPLGPALGHSHPFMADWRLLTAKHMGTSNNGGGGAKGRGGGPSDVPSYSITSSARSSIDTGTSRSSALAVLRLSDISNLTGAWTGSSLGFAPLRMRST